MTQALIANMLGVRREGVTECAVKLQSAGLIHYARGRIKVLDRSGLEKRTCECYTAKKGIRPAAAIESRDLEYAARPHDQCSKVSPSRY